MGTIINVIAVLIGGIIGLLLRGRFPERFTETALHVMGLFTIFVGINMALQGNEIILIILSLVFGALLGELINIEKQLERFGVWVEGRLNIKKESPAKGFIFTSLVFCVGSMAIVGSITDGVKGDHSILVTKSLMDGVISIPFAATMGIGVLGSAFSILVYQGTLTLLAKELQPLFTTHLINELTAVGGIIVMGIGVNILGIKKIRVGNFLPSLLLIIIFVYIKALLT